MERGGGGGGGEEDEDTGDSKRGHIKILGFLFAKDFTV